MAFVDRSDAGRQLAQRLGHLAGTEAVVLALPRGGVPVAAEIASALGLPLDLAWVRKIGLPGHEELAVAAIAGPEGETLVINKDIARRAGIGRDDIARLAGPQRAEILRRRQVYGVTLIPLAGKTAVLVDDGIATGATMRAAIAATREQRPKRVILAIPVASREALAEIGPEVNEIVCLVTPELFSAVGAYYRHFPQLGDGEVARLLAAQRATHALPDPE
jgi:putative phosphoribosyl transferase